MKHVIAILFSCGALAVAQQAPAIGGCPAFPVTNVWNVAVDKLPVLSNSAAIMAKIGTATDHFHLDDVIPVTLVPGTQPLVAVGGLAYGYGPDGGGSDPGLWPIPSNVLIESGSDGHALIVDTTNCLLYEIFALSGAPGAWFGASAAKWDLNSNALRPDGGTSADAAGLPLTPGLLRYADIAAGSLNHALRISVPTTQWGVYTWPARHYASSTKDPNLPMMGQRLRLKAAFDVSGFSATNQIILRGLQKYGVLVADNGMAWGMQHDQDSRWNAADLLALHNILGSNMEVVDESGLMSGPDSGMAVVPPPPGVFVSDAFGRQNSVPFGPGISIVNGVLAATGGSGGTGPVLSVAGRTGNVTLGIWDVLGLQDALNGKQSLLPYTPERALTFASPILRSGDTISCPACSGASGSIAGASSTLTVATMSSPTPTTTLTGSSVTLYWNAGTNAARYWLDVGNGPLTAEYATGALTATSKTVSGLPCDGRTLYVSLYTMFNGAADYARPPQEYTYTACSGGASTVATVFSPAPATTLPGSAVTFSWNAGANASRYWLDVGNGPLMGEYTTGALTATYRTVSGLPCDGRTLYVSLYTMFNGAADYTRPPQQYTYTATSFFGSGCSTGITLPNNAQSPALPDAAAQF